MTQVAPAQHTTPERLRDACVRTQAMAAAEYDSARYWAAKAIEGQQPGTRNPRITPYAEVFATQDQETGARLSLNERRLRGIEP